VDVSEAEKLRKKQVISGKLLGWNYRPNDIESKVNQRKVLDSCTKPSKRPLVSLQVLRLKAISRNNHPKEEIYTLDYTFRDPEIKINTSDPYPRPIGFDPQPYTELQLERFIKSRYIDWVKAGGYRLYQEKRGS
jgi:hypothetical protein